MSESQKAPMIAWADAVEELPVTSWQGPYDAALRERAVRGLEAGKVLLLPRLPFVIAGEETRFLDAATAGAARKNISYDSRNGKLANAAVQGAESERLAGMMRRFSDGALQLVSGLFPAYAGSLERARTSFRPQEIEGRAYSPRHDDRRLHVDAFPSTPMRGRRILRVFTNVAGDGALRHWRVGESFADFARKFTPRLKAPLPGSAWLLSQLHITKSRRSAYDHYMLGLHDGAKLDLDYQARAPRADLNFAPGNTWLCYSDQVLHAALSGHGAMEQSFYLPVSAMVDPSTTPLRVLESITGRALA